MECGEADKYFQTNRMPLKIFVCRCSSEGCDGELEGKIEQLAIDYVRLLFI